MSFSGQNSDLPTGRLDDMLYPTPLPQQYTDDTLNSVAES